MNRENLHAHIDYELITAVHLGANASKKAKSTANATIVSRAAVGNLSSSPIVWAISNAFSRSNTASCVLPILDLNNRR